MKPRLVMAGEIGGCAEAKDVCSDMFNFTKMRKKGLAHSSPPTRPGVQERVALSRSVVASTSSVP
jgi:hypothetical protein